MRQGKKREIGACVCRIVTIRSLDIGLRKNKMANLNAKGDSEAYDHVKVKLVM